MKKESTTRKTVTKSKIMGFLFYPATISILVPVAGLSTIKKQKPVLNSEPGNPQQMPAISHFFTTSGKSRMEYYPKVGFVKQESSFKINRAKWK